MTSSTHLELLLDSVDLDAHPIIYEDWIGKWRNGNDAGLGYPAGDDGDSVLVAGLGIGELVDWEPSSGAMLFVEAGGGYVVIAEANGAWAVPVQLAPSRWLGER